MTHQRVLWAVDVAAADPRPQRLFDPGLDAAPQAMALLPPSQTASGALEVLLAVNDTILVVGSDAAHDTRLAVGCALLKLAVAPGGQFVAAWAADGRLLVWVADFTNV